jgi:hypothetical protein
MLGTACANLEKHIGCPCKNQVVEARLGSKKRLSTRIKPCAQLFVGESGETLISISHSEQLLFLGFILFFGYGLGIQKLLEFLISSAEETRTAAGCLFCRLISFCLIGFNDFYIIVWCCLILL